MLTNFSKGLAIVLALGLSSATWAQGAYPQKPVTLIVPFPAGGIADLSARALKASLDKALGQPVLIVNRPGASGAIGAAAVTNAVYNATGKRVRDLPITPAKLGLKGTV